MLYIHIDKEYEIDDIIKEFRKYDEEKNVNDIIKEFKEYYKQKKAKLDNIVNYRLTILQILENIIIRKKLI